MSVVYDPKFLATIISLGQAKPDAGKVMSDAIKDSDYAEIDGKILNSLISKLESESAPASADQMSDAVSTLADSANKPTPGDLNNVGNFVGYISKNQITYNGKPIVMFGGERNIQPTQKLENIPVTKPQEVGVAVPSNNVVAHYYINGFEKLAQVALPTGAEISTDASGNKVAKIGGVDYINYNGLYWVNKDYLTNYLYELQRSAVKGGNKLFSSMVDSLTNKINADRALNVKVENKKDQLKAEEDKKKLEEAGKAKTQKQFDIGSIDQETSLDKIPVLINLVSGNSLSEGTENIKVKDLMSPSAFDSFIKANKQLRLKMKVNDQESEQEIVGKAKYCLLAGFLNKRADEKNTAQDEVSNLYVKLTEALQQAYCGSTQNLDLANISSVFDQSSKSLSGAQTVSYQKFQEENNKYLTGLIENGKIILPLSSESGMFTGNISIDRIVSFVNAITSLYNVMLKRYNSVLAKDKNYSDTSDFSQQLAPYIGQFFTSSNEIGKYWNDLKNLTTSKSLTNLSVGQDPGKYYGTDSVDSRMSQVFGAAKPAAAGLVNKILGNIIQMLGYLKYTPLSGLGFKSGIDSNIKIAGELSATMSRIENQSPAPIKPNNKVPGFLG